MEKSSNLKQNQQNKSLLVLSKKHLIDLKKKLCSRNPETVSISVFNPYSEVQNIVSAVIHDDEENYIRDFFFPIDHFYHGSSFDDNDTKTRLKDLVRHQIVSSLKNKSCCGYNIELNTIYNQKIQIGYFETKVDFGSIPTLKINRFYVFKLYRKLGYSGKALLHVLNCLMEKYFSISKIFVEFFETNRSIAIVLVKLGFKMCKSKASELKEEKRLILNKTLQVLNTSVNLDKLIFKVSQHQSLNLNATKNYDTAKISNSGIKNFTKKYSEPNPQANNYFYENFKTSSDNNEYCSVVNSRATSRKAVSQMRCYYKNLTNNNFPPVRRTRRTDLDQFDRDLIFKNNENSSNNIENSVKTKGPPKLVSYYQNFNNSREEIRSTALILPTAKLSKF